MWNDNHPLLLIAAVYFIPFFIAAARGHANTLAIFVANAFLGWTVVFWFVILVWAFTANTRQRGRGDDDYGPLYIEKRHKWR
jgi:hypothetical protein